MRSYQPLTSDDPFIGDAGALRDYAHDLRTTGDAAAKVAAAVKDVAASSQASWAGDAADGFRARSEDGAAPLKTLGERLNDTAKIIDDYATSLGLAEYCGRAFANQAHDALVARRWIQQQLDAANWSAAPDPFAVGNLRLQLNDQDNEFTRLRRRFDEVQADFEESVDKTRAALFKLWSLDSRLDPSGKSGELIAKPKPKLQAYPGLGHDKDVRQGTNDNGNHVREETGSTAGLLGRGKGTTQTVTTTTKPSPGSRGLPERGKTKKIEYSHDGKIAPADPKKSAAKKVAGSTKVTVASASSKAESSRGAKAEKQGKNFGGEAHAGGDAKAKANASVSVGADGIKVTAGASASAKLEVAASGRVTSKYVNGDASVHASIGAEAEGKATLGIGKDGLNAGIDAKAFVGGEVGADANIDIGGLGAGGHAGVTYGIGAEFDVKAKVSLDNVSVKADLGATLGLGFHASVDINIHPKELIHNVADFFGL
jgi:uncharacterized protein YukE